MRRTPFETLRATALAALLAACSGGSGGGGEGATFTIGGTVVGLADGKRLVVANGAVQAALERNGRFTLQSGVSDGTAYTVTILGHPEGQICVVRNGNGVVRGADVADIEILCENRYVRLSWAPSRQADVARGGGYRIYWSRNADFHTGDANVQGAIEIPADPATPPEVRVPAPGPGRWYFRVQAFHDRGESALSEALEVNIE